MDADDELALSPDQNDLLIDEGDAVVGTETPTADVNEALLDEDETVTDDAVTSDIRGKVALSSQLNNSEGSALTDVLNKDPQLRKPVKLPQIPKLSIAKMSKSKQQQNLDECLGNSINPAVKKICKEHGLKDVAIEYKDNDFQQINDYKSYVKKFKPRIQLANPSIGMSLLMKLLVAKWNDFLSRQKEKKNITGFLSVDQDESKPSVSLPHPHRKPNCNDPRMKSVESSSSQSSSLKQNMKKRR